MNSIDKHIAELFPHTDYCKEKIKELEEKFKMTTDCLCDTETKRGRKKFKQALIKVREEQKEKDAKIAEGHTSRFEETMNADTVGFYPKVEIHTSDYKKGYQQAILDISKIIRNQSTK